MKKRRFYRLFKGFYEQYFIALLFMALTPAVFYSRPIESILALAAIFLGILADISINRVYDAEDDAIEEWKSRSNPISRGEINKDVGWMFCVNIYFISIILSLLTGDIIFAFILAVRNLLGFLYSGPPVRAKSSPLIDVLFHLMIIDSGPAFMALMYTRNFTPLPLYMIGFLALNSMFTQISQELR
ncbi:MAG: UbiA family prenyltransferase, partial [Candidatus Altiarchaeota archaeon]